MAHNGTHTLLQGTRITENLTRRSWQVSCYLNLHELEVDEGSEFKGDAMKANNHPKKILLAVDLKAEDPSLTKRLWKAVKPLMKADTIVEPISVLNRQDVTIATLRSRLGKLRLATEKLLAEHLEELGLKNFAPPKVLFADSSSTQSAVMALLSYAKKNGCDLIAVSSHSRRGVKRFFLGSFAESLSLQSPIPLLVVNPIQRDLGRSNTILFPTDFSKQSKAGLERVCDSFRNLKPRIILFHNYLFPAQIYMEPFVSYPLPQSAMKEEFKRVENIGKNWCAWLKEEGITCELLMDRKARSVAEGVLSAIRRKKVEMVAMVSTTGKVGALLLGSVTREVLRNSPRPVWVVHPGKESGKKGIKLTRVPTFQKSQLNVQTVAYGR